MNVLTVARARYTFGVICLLILFYIALSYKYELSEKTCSPVLNDNQHSHENNGSKLSQNSLILNNSRIFDKEKSVLLHKINKNSTDGEMTGKSNSSILKNNDTRKTVYMIDQTNTADKKLKTELPEKSQSCLARARIIQKNKEAARREKRIKNTGSDNKSSSGKTDEPDPSVYFSYSKTVITPVNQTFLIPNKDFCKKSSPEHIIFVLSSPHNFEKRSAIRTTYGTLSRDRKSFIYGLHIQFVVRVVFLIGKTSSTVVTNSIFDESKRHGDIVLIDLIDTYRDLTKKVLYGLKWVTKFCSQVSYVTKADDDVFINVALLIKRIKEHRPVKNGTVFGYLYNGQKLVARTGEWAVTYEEYPFKSYPDYMSGTSYTMTMNLVPKILYTAQRLTFLHIEDAFIIGVNAKKMHGARLVHLGANSRWHCTTPKLCHFIKYHRISMTNITPQRMYEAWHILTTNGTKSDGTKCA